GEAEEILASLEGIRSLEINPQGGTVEIGLTTEENQDITEAVFFAFAEAKKPILEMRPIRSSLEDIFLELTGSKEEVAYRRESHRVGGKEEA
ncbi:MAG: ABC transporter, partial [Clostridia bacterium]|nr:ABC transporter [Clostridia bacterium]